VKKSTRWVGLDVHGETIAVAVAEKDGTVRSLGTIPNRPEAVGRMIRKVGDGCKLHVCYEAGPCGYVLYWQLAEMGIDCQVVAPTLIPMKVGDRVKTDRRDAEKLARCHRSGDLTAVWVPDAEQEALRDLVRARHAGPEGTRAWGSAHMHWLEGRQFRHVAHQEVFVDHLHEVKHVAERIGRLEKAIDGAIEHAPERMRLVIEALQTLRGVAKITAVTLVAEVGAFERFESPRQLMAYVGVVPREHSSGDKTRRGSITKTGNARMRHVLGEAAWTYRSKPSVQGNLRKRQDGQSDEVKAMAWKAQHRLHMRYRKMSSLGKHHGRVVTAVSRELIGFVWAIGRHIEQQHQAAA
jgi:transposase